MPVERKGGEEERGRRDEGERELSRREESMREGNARVQSSREDDAAETRGGCEGQGSVEEERKGKENASANSRRHVLVIQLQVLVLRSSKQPRTQPPSSSQRNRSQKLLYSDVSDGEDVLDVGLLPLVEQNVSVLLSLDSSSLEVHLGGHGVSSNSPENSVDLESGIVVEVKGESSGRGLGDFEDVGFAVDVDAGSD